MRNCKFDPKCRYGNSETCCLTKLQYFGIKGEAKNP